MESKNVPPLGELSEVCVASRDCGYNSDADPMRTKGPTLCKERVTGTEDNMACDTVTTLCANKFADPATMGPLENERGEIPVSSSCCKS